MITTTTQILKINEAINFRSKFLTKFSPCFGVEGHFKVILL